MTGPLIVAILVASGVWLVLQRARIRAVLGFVLLAHAANVVLILSSTGPGRDVPIVGLAGDAADPLPQAFALTAVVIAFGVTAFLLSLAWDTEHPEDETDDGPDAEEADDRGGRA